MGRPSNIDDTTAQVIIQEHSRGKDLVECCQLAGVSWDSMTRKRDADPSFRASLARAYGEGSQFFLTLAEAGMRTSTPRTFNRAREQLHHARWRASSKLVETLQRMSEQHQKLQGELPMLEIIRRMAFALAKGAHQVEQQRAPREPVLLEHSPSTGGASARHETGNHLED